jgi:hypothetical protein
VTAEVVHAGGMWKLLAGLRLRCLAMPFAFHCSDTEDASYMNLGDCIYCHTIRRTSYQICLLPATQARRRRLHPLDASRIYRQAVRPLCPTADQRAQSAVKKSHRDVDRYTNDVHIPTMVKSTRRSKSIPSPRASSTTQPRLNNQESPRSSLHIKRRHSTLLPKRPHPAGHL